MYNNLTIQKQEMIMKIIVSLQFTQCVQALKIIVPKTMKQYGDVFMQNVKEKIDYIILYSLKFYIH